jgi:tubulin polyglutamylase complex subunit 2
MHPSLADIDLSDSEDDSGQPLPHFDSRSKLFELESCDPYGAVVLVYDSRITKAGEKSACTLPCIWFLDRSLQWHWLTDSFISYYRLLVLHLGLPEWQCVFTTTGLSSGAKRWFNLLAPDRLMTDLNKGNPKVAESLVSHEPSFVNHLDSSRIHKAKPLTAEKRLLIDDLSDCIQ